MYSVTYPQFAHFPEFFLNKTALKINSGLEHEILRYDFKSLNWNRIYCSVSHSDMIKSKLGDKLPNLSHDGQILSIC